MNTKTTSSGSKKSGMGGVSNMAGGYTTIAVYGGKMSGTAYAGCHIFLICRHIFSIYYVQSVSIIFHIIITFIIMIHTLI